MRAFAPAKLNLALHVTGRRDDGYHLLDSLVVFAGVGDWVTAEPATAMSLKVSGAQARGVPDDARNLMWQAAEALGVPAALTLEKALPAAGGIGGGSSDAAAVLRVLSPYAAPSADLALSLGADVPVCLGATPTRMSGIGENLAPVPHLPPLWCVLANAGIDVPTGAVFKALPRVDNAPLPSPEWQDGPSFFAWLAQTRNDMEAAATALVPEIETVLDALRAEPTAAFARMSGSGGTCFALCETQADAERLQHAVALAHPTWWVTAAPILSSNWLAEMRSDEQS